MIDSEYFAQGIGLLASALIIASFTHKSDRHFKILITVGNLLFFCHFFLLGAYAGAVVNLINCFRAGLSIKFYNSNILMSLFFVVYTISGVILYQNPQDVLPIFSGIVGSFAMYKLSGSRLRACLFISSLSWFTHDFIYKSIGGMVTEVFAQVMNMITIFRLYRDKKKVCDDKNI